MYAELGGRISYRVIFLGDFYREDTDMTRLNLDYSGSSSINAWLESYQGPPPKAIPHPIARLNPHGIATEEQG